MRVYAFRTTVNIPLGPPQGPMPTQKASSVPPCRARSLVLIGGRWFARPAPIYSGGVCLPCGRIPKATKSVNSRIAFKYAARNSGVLLSSQRLRACSLSCASSSSFHRSSRSNSGAMLDLNRESPDYERLLCGGSLHSVEGGLTRIGEGVILWSNSD